ncbi:MAG: FkbM family methyltransferase [Chthonomonadales bacterium]|nr:FkbM family methyltransferase [Chthonomonadales bacterium]
MAKAAPMNFSNPALRRNPIRTAVRVAWSMALKRRPPTRPLVVPFDEGRLRIYADMQTAFGRQMYRFGVLEPDLRLVRHLLRPGEVFVDGGAHVGLFSLVAAHAVGPEGTVYSFEPVSETFRQLAANALLNGLANVRMYCEALGAISGETDFTVMQGDRAPWSHMGSPSDGEVGVRLKVPVATLAERIPTEVWRKIALVKLDIEGAELDALRGGEPILDAAHPPILMEFVPGHFDGFGIKPHDVLAFLTDKAYRLLRPSDDPEVWISCSPEQAMHLDPERPNLLATVSLEAVSRRGVRVVNDG